MEFVKKHIILIILFKSALLTGQPFFNETSQWKQYRHLSFYPDIVWIDDNLIRIDGDTLIGSTLYYKVLKTGTHLTLLAPQYDTVIFSNVHSYLHPIRQENQFVYAYNPTTGVEYLLYDFSAEIGETLQAGDCYNFPVINIDTVYLGDKPRRRFSFDQLGGRVQIEGIGSTKGLFEAVCLFSQSQLQCYCQDGDCIQFTSSAPNLDCSSLILANERIEENTFSISPNPFHDEIQIRFLDEVSQNASIRIINLLGAVMFEKVIQSPEPVEHLDVSYLQAGIYVVLILSKGRYSAEKIVKL